MNAECDQKKRGHLAGTILIPSNLPSNQSAFHSQRVRKGAKRSHLASANRLMRKSLQLRKLTTHCDAMRLTTKQRATRLERATFSLEG